MKLSKAILKGCEMAPRQIHGRYFDDMGGACALGAAALAVGFPAYFVRFALMDRFGITLHGIGQVMNENDRQRIPREQIAASLAEAGL